MQSSLSATPNYCTLQSSSVFRNSTEFNSLKITKYVLCSVILSVEQGATAAWCLHGVWCLHSAWCVHDVNNTFDCSPTFDQDDGGRAYWLCKPCLPSLHFVCFSKYSYVPKLQHGHHPALNTSPTSNWIYSW